jgi:hypothetical protein
MALEERRKVLKDNGVTKAISLLEDAIDRDQVVVSSAELLEQVPEGLEASEALARIKAGAAENAEILRYICALLYERRVVFAKDATQESRRTYRTA